MVSYDPTVAGNLKSLQRQINKAGIAPMGPVALTPGMGHIRLNDGTSDTGFLDFNGIQLRYRGAMRGLTDLTESFASSIEDQADTLASHGTRLDSSEARLGSHDSALDIHWNRIGTAQGRADDAFYLASSKASTEWVSTIEAKNTAQDGRLGSHDSVLATHENWISTAQGRADDAFYLAGDAVADASTAQSRADSAHDRIDGLSNQVQALRSEVHYWMQTARASNPSLPPPIPN